MAGGPGTPIDNHQSISTMKICRFNENRLGVVEGRNVQDITAAVDSIPTPAWPQPPGDLMIGNLQQLLPIMHKLRRESETFSLRDLHLNSPIARPSKIIGAPINYAAHQDEVEHDPELIPSGQVGNVQTSGLFLKAPIPVGPDDGVKLSFQNRRTDHEVELAIVIGQNCRKVTEDEALDYVAGYTIGLDMTIRGGEDRSLRKALDSHSVLGPWLVTRNEIENPDNLEISLALNGSTRQHSNTKNMIYSTRKLIAYASSYYTLYPGDVIMCGTPAGVGPVTVGDTLECSIEKIGSMQVAIKAA